MASSARMSKVVSTDHCDRKYAAPRTRGLEIDADRSALLASQSGITPTDGGSAYRAMAMAMGLVGTRQKRGMKTSSGNK